MKFYHISYNYTVGQSHGFGSTVLKAPRFVPTETKLYIESQLNRQLNRRDSEVIIMSKIDLTEEEYNLELKAYQPQRGR